MSKSSIAAPLSVFFAFILSGCETPGPSPQESGLPVESAAVEAAEYTPDPALKSEDRFRLIMQLLLKNRPDHARQELLLYLEHRPDRKVAADLLRQINLPAEEYFPTEYRDVQLSSGESLSTLSRTYFGSVYQFYALAKYNNISDLNNVKAGQTIRIPLTDTAVQAFADAQKVKETGEPTAATSRPDSSAQPAEPSAAPAAVESVKTLTDKGNFDGAIALIESQPPATTEDRVIAATTYEKSADSLATSKPKLASKRYQKSASLLKEDNQATQALALLERSVGVDAGNKSAKDQLKKLKTELVEKYHREASNAFRSQKLDEAIRLCDQVLAIDPDYTNAQAYRSQAIELRDKLSSLE